MDYAFFRATSKKERVFFNKKLIFQSAFALEPKILKKVQIMLMLGKKTTKVALSVISRESLLVMQALGPLVDTLPSELLYYYSLQSYYCNNYKIAFHFICTVHIVVK